MNSFFPSSCGLCYLPCLLEHVSLVVVGNRHLSSVIADFGFQSWYYNKYIVGASDCKIYGYSTKMTNGVHARKSHPTSSLVIDRIPSE